MTSYVPIGGVRRVGRKRTYRAAAGALLSISLLLPAPTAEATFPGTNGRIFFETGRNIYSVNQDGSNRQLVVRSTDYVGPLGASPKLMDPAVSPNGKRLAFSTGGDIWVKTIGGGRREVTENARGLTGVRYPAWSPTGKKIVFRADKKQDGIFYARMYTVNSDGTGLTQIKKFSQGHFSQHQLTPDWSFDNEIVYSNYAGLWVINPNGSGNTLLLEGTYPNPSWSPDGDTIATEQAIGSGPPGCCLPGIIAVDRATLTETEITGDANLNSEYQNPTWSPDGSMVAFEGWTDGAATQVFDIYTVTVEGKVFDDLDTVPTGGDKDSFAPAWGVFVP